MYTKTKIFNLALSALLLTKQVADADSDTSTECRTLNLHWDTALFTTLQDLNLDGTSSQMNLELEATDPNTLWKYAYKYPTKCAYFRRIQSGVRKDTRSTQIPMRTGMIGSSKVIFCNESPAIGEFIPSDISIPSLSASAGLCVAYALAQLAAPLVAGKYTLKIKQDIVNSYGLQKMNAQEQDRLENATFDTDEEMSEFVEARLS